MSIIRFNQSIATAGKSTFIYTFEVTNKEDIAVFLTPNGQDANDVNDRLILDTQYVVDGVGEEQGGQIVLAENANAGDRITLVGQRKAQPPADFQEGQLSADQLNAAFNSLTILIQDIQTQICRQMVSYDASNLFPPENTQTQLPVLEENEVWVGTINNGIVTVTIPDGVEAGILRAQLADDQDGQDGSFLVGYFNTVFTPNSTTVHAALEQLEQKVLALESPALSLEINENLILGGDFSTNPFQEGTTTVMLPNTRKYVADGWTLEQQGTLNTTVTRSTDVPSITGDGAKILFINSIAIELTVQQGALGATDKLVFQQPIEGNVFRPIAQTEEISMPFWVKSPLIGKYTVALRNEARDQFIVKEYTINSSNVWQLIILEFEKSPVPGGWNYEEGIGLIASFTLAAGADLETAILDEWLVGDEISSADQVNFAGEPVNSKFLLAGIELSNKSSLPLPRRSKQQELEFAQRHFEKSYNLDIAPGTANSNGSKNTRIAIRGTFIPDFCTSLKVTKRFQPETRWFSPFTGAIDNIHDATAGGADFPVIGVEGEGQTSTGFPETSLPSIDDGKIAVGHWTSNARLLPNIPPSP